MKFYELTYLISPDLSEEELRVFQEKINSFIKEDGGRLEKSKNPIERKLEYPIKERERGHLATLDFHFEPEKLENLEKKLKRESSILRYLILAKRISKKIEIPRITPEIKIKKFKKEKKVELEKIEEKLEEILGEI
ncbi:30S ribosomal protein S6 [Patescibacteria group bacterium]|nr:30S ribosomal protein S6 [Patescibacteria group bacterium]